MTSPIGGLLAGLGQGAVQGLQYRDKMRLLQTQQDEERAWREAQAERERQQTALILGRLQGEVEERAAKAKAAAAETEASERARAQVIKVLTEKGVSPDEAEAVSRNPTALATYLRRPDEPKPTPTVEERDHLGGKALFKDGTFDRWVIRPQAERDPSPVAGMLQGQREFQRVSGLKQDYSQEPVIKQAQAYASAFQGVMAAAQRDDAQSNLALMYEAVKMRDPNAVREGELALQAKARSVPTWLRGMWDKASRGNVLTTDERRQIVQWAQSKIDEQRSIVNPIMARYGETARRFGVPEDSAFIARDPFEGVSRPNGSGSDLRRRY